ncbi:MAG: 2-hydroxyacyl-CoA dehydratase subunit D [Anaerococcus sp.]
MRDYIEKCKEIVSDPLSQIKGYVNEGKKIIGMIPFFGPEELVDAAGFVPYGINADYNLELDISKQYFPAFCPSIIANVLEQGLNGSLDDLSAVILPAQSDTLICLGQNWKSGVENVPFIQIVYPQNRKLDCGIEFLETELVHVKEKLEEIKGSEITDDDINKSIELYNQHRAEMRRFSELAAKHPNTINNFDRNYVYKSAFYIRKEEHLEIVKHINEELEKLPEEKYAGNRIITTGLVLDDENILKSLEDNNLRIVGDYVALESIQYNTDVPEGDNPFNRLAKQWSNIEGFSIAYDPDLKRGDLISKLAKERDAIGVLYATVKFSDYEEYDMPICTDIIRDNDLQVDIQDSGSEQIKTRIQTFAEIL